MRNIVLILMLLICSPVMGQDYISSTANDTTPLWNEELRQVRDGVSQAKALVATILPINLASSSQVTGALPIANGGTGQVTAQAAIDALLPSQSSNSGKFLTTNGTTSSWGTVSPSTSNVIFSYASSSPWSVTNTSYTTIISSKWKKIAGVSTITVYGLITCSNNGSLYVNVGGANSSSNDINGGPTWTNAVVIDVSGLSNGTLYDVTIQIKASGSATVTTNSIIGFGS